MRGGIENLDSAKKMVNLVNGKLAGNLQAGSAMAQAISANVGLASSSSTVTMHDGKEMDYFACYIDYKLVQGCFPYATFSNGDRVKVVADVSKGENYALAILDEEKRLLWMPLMMGFGVGATLIQSMKLGVYLTVAVYLFFIFFITLTMNRA